MKKKLLLLNLLLIFILTCSDGRNIANQVMDSKTIRKNIRLSQSENWEIRKYAIKVLALGNYDSKTQLVKKFFLISSEDNHPSIRMEALKGLGALKEADTIPRIKEMIFKDENDNVKWYALKILTLFNNPECFEIFKISFNNDDWLIRETAIEGILQYQGTMNDNKIIPYIIKGLKDKNESVKIMTLRKTTIREKNLYRIINKIFKEKKESSHPLLKASLVAMKGYIIDLESREDLIKMLGHRNRKVRLLAFHVLKKENQLKRLEEH